MKIPHCVRDDRQDFLAHNLTKQTLRENALARRLQIAPQDRALAEKEMTRRFLEGVSLKPAAIVAGYWPVKAEIGVVPLLQELIRHGHRAALPCVVESRRPLAFREWHEGAPMVEGRYGIHQPDPETCAVVMPDVVIVPLLGFDMRGHRLGYGSGFYDRTFAQLRGAHPFLAVGAAFDAQKLEEVPAGPYDYAMDMIVTDKKIYTFERRTS